MGKPIGLATTRLGALPMPLPDLIEIQPLLQPVRAAVKVPGSKSITNRALVLAALSEGMTTLTGALWSEDTQVMVQCLQTLGFTIHVQLDPEEHSNRTIQVHGLGGHFPPSNRQEPFDLFVGNAGTAARFLSAMLCLGQGTYRLHGVPRMHERPQAPLFEALRELGYRIDSPNNKLPATIHGSGPRSNSCRVSTIESSQFASALLLCALIGGWKVEILGFNREESPYITMTSSLIKSFPIGGGEFQIEPDASSGSYFWGAGHLLHPPSNITVQKWPDSGWQIDADLPNYLPLPSSLSRADQLGDAIMTAIVLGPFAEHPTTFTNLGRLRVQECERVQALRTELAKCGAKIQEIGDTLIIHPSPLHGATIETYHDHRMAMCFGMLGLKVPGIKIQNPSCVKKTFPDFFAKLAVSPPQGLGATLLNGATGQTLSTAELIAD